jgi:hypothetical protein
VSCARSLRRAADAGNEQRIRPATGHTAPAPGQSSHLELSLPDADGEPHGTVASSSARHGWLRRNAVSPVGVRLGGAPGAELLMGCSSANRVLASRLGRDGIVAVPRVFHVGGLFSSDTRTSVGLPGGCHPGMRVSGAAAWTLSDSSPQLADTRQRTEVPKGVAAIVDIWRLSKAPRINSGPWGAGATGRRA